MAYLLRSDYTDGTITVAANGTVVTGTGTAWVLSEFLPGDWFYANGFGSLIQSVDSDTQITLYAPWRGGALTNANYVMRYQPSSSRTTAQARNLVNLLGDSGNLEALGGLSGTPNTFPYFTGAGTMGLTTLGTASGSNVTANATDETAGRLLKVGDNINFYRLRDFGTYYSPTSNRNIDTVPVGDVGRYSTSNPGTFPPGSTNFWITTQRIFSNDAKVQVAIPYSPTGATEPSQWIRIAAGDGTYGPWRMTYNNGNVLGTVSQSGGVPTGAIIERGSNANGEYVRFADGTLICGRISVSGTSAAWASPFVATPFAVASTTFSDARITTILNLTNLTVRVQSYTTGGTASSATGPVIGFGRWF